MSFFGKLWAQKRFGSALAFRVIARFAGSLGQAGFLILLARELGPAEFGIVAIVLSVGYIVSAFTSFGTGVRVLRLAAETDSQRTATKFLYMRITGTALTAVICSTMVFAASPTSTLIAVSMIASDQVVDYAQAYLAGTNRQIKSSLVVIFQRLIPFMVIGSASVASFFSGELIMISFLSTLICGLLIPLRERAKSVRYWSKDTWSELKGSTGYWMSSLAPNIGQLQAPALGLVVDAASVGLFAIAARLTNPLSILVGALQTLLMPELARRRGTARFRTLYRASVSASAAYGLALCLSAWLITDIAILLLGRDYESARWLIIGMIIASGMSAVSQAFQSKLLAEGRAAVVAWIVGTGSSIGLAALVVIVALGGMPWLWVSPIVAQAIIAVGLASSANAALPRVGRHSNH
ncbi:lipopolysaccharide biosynthesis protein [Arthrobacter sp. NPDC058288]|uniref:lipopolysaccharide biosynthesis protein n=1 Tax=Arthrobacter sp. NPDC058288 TaxID=3346424 RepID=UPI0036E94940